MAVIKKITRLTIKQKSEILHKISKGESVISLCKAYKVNKSTVCRIKKQKLAVDKFVANSENGPGTRCTLKAAEYPRMEKALYKWFLRQRKLNVPISGLIIREMARCLHTKIKEKPGEFNASEGWLKNFKKRYGIRYLKVTGEKLTNKKHLVAPSKDTFQKKIADLGLTLDQIYNADESGLYFRLLPDHTFVSAVEKSAPGRKLCKERVTFLPCTNASGAHKLKLLVIGKSMHPRAFNNFHNNPVAYKANRNAWMTSVLFEDWFHTIFVPEVIITERNSLFIYI